MTDDDREPDVPDLRGRKLIDQLERGRAPRVTDTPAPAAAPVVDEPAPTPPPHGPVDERVMRKAYGAARGGRTLTDSTIAEWARAVDALVQVANRIGTIARPLAKLDRAVTRLRDYAEPLARLEQTRAAVAVFLREFLAEHPVTRTGQCAQCGRYGVDCFGSRAADILAALDAWGNGDRDA